MRELICSLISWLNGWIETSEGKLERACKEHFQSRSERGDGFWGKLDAAFPGCCCEQVSVSDLSPGPVRDEEVIASAVTSRNYVSGGKILPTIFDQRIGDGLSVDRVRYSDKAAFDRRAEALVEGSLKKEYLGAICLSVTRIRQVTDSGRRCFAVYDTAENDYVSHAEIAQTNHPPPSTPARKVLRAGFRKSLLDAALHEQRVVGSEVVFAS
jgi:hypothetical protein